MRLLRAALVAIALAHCTVAFSQQTPQRAGTPVDKQDVTNPTNSNAGRNVITVPAPSSGAADGRKASGMEGVNTQNAERSTEQPNEDWWHKFRTDPVATFTALLFFATVALWLSTRSLVKGSEETAERELRAYVFAESGGTATLGIADRAAARLIVRNSGKTPAYDVVYKIGVDVGDKFLPEWDDERPDRSRDKTNSGSPALPPGAHIILDPESAATLDFDTVEKCRSGEFAVYVHGLIEYRDAFGKPRWTQFRMYRNRGTGELALSAEGNEAT